MLGYSRGNLNRYFVRDMLGSVIDVVNAGGQHMEGYTYTPYGELWWPKEPTEFVPFRFAQGYMDTETGLQKHGVRYYDPTQARFTQMDPLFGKIGQPITLNRYQYANCDPANNGDPSGQNAIRNVGQFFYGCGSGLVESRGYAAAAPAVGAGVGFVAGLLAGVPFAGAAIGFGIGVASVPFILGGFCVVRGIQEASTP